MRRLGRVGSGAVVMMVTAALLVGCAANASYHQGKHESSMNDWDRAVLSYAKALSLDPENPRYEIALLKAKQRASQGHFEKGLRYLDANQLDLAIGELQQSAFLDPTNQHVQVELDKALIAWKKERESIVKTEMELMKEKAKADRGVPKLSASSNIPIILKFKDTEISQIYEALSKASGINFLYDSKIDLKKKTSIELTNVTFEDAMNTLMLINKHFYKVVDENTILIADDSQQKRREIEDEVIKTFFLSNADVKDVQTLLRTLLDARKIVQNNQLNAITIRDTPNRVAIAEKIIEANDKSKAELVIDVELLEISRAIGKTLGLNLTPQRFTASFTGPTSLPLNNLGLLRDLGNWSIGPIPSVTLDFLKADASTRQIAKPQLRVTEGEKANLHLGDSVPIPTTTFNTGSTVGSNIVPITSFTYQEVGIVIEIEPRVHHNKEVTLKLNVEVSQLGEQVSTGQGQSAPAINTRQINTVIRLKDGETNLLAGLIRDEGSEARGGFAGLTDIPGIRKIFTSNISSHRETDLVLTLTPHIIRIPDIRDEDLAAIFIGTEGNPHLRGKGSSPFALSPFTAKEGEEEAAAEEEAETAEGAAAPEAAKPAGEAAKPAAQPPAAQKPPTPIPVPAVAPPAPSVQPARPRAEDDGVLRPDEEDIQLELEKGEEDAQPPAAQPPAGLPPTGQPAQPAQPPAGQPPTGQPAQPTPQPPPAPPSATTPLTVALAPGRLTVAGGGGFAFNIMVAGASNLQKISLTLKYDPAVAEFDQGLEGIFMRADGVQTSFSAQKAGEGTVNVEVQRLSGDKGATGNGSIAAIRFRPVGSGRTLINVVGATALDPQGAPIQVNPNGADVTISQ